MNPTSPAPETKTLLITGATSGIGYAAARHFIELGWKLVITGRDKARLERACEKLKQETGAEVLGILADSAELSHLGPLVQTLDECNIRLDGLLLNAGVFQPFALTDMSDELYEQTMQVNFKGPLFTLNALLPKLNRGASVVYTSSIAVDKGFAGAAIYSASKGAFEAAMKALNLELAGQKIRINSLRPGVTLTEIQQKAGFSQAQIDGLGGQLAATAFGDFLLPSHMLSALTFLLSPGSEGVIGTTVTVDGGYCL
ncbi:SDR family oxidoreductase [Shewanella sp. JM162201]|uniref:SDR family oxidoreductase n=1 Tax=Shewanella jiangmenensis TaxID=2837387 RepID=A0ABS5UYT4_9GAMM|nr:SDR family oxidoreductase [Shewanella jiangmenensis]MBT1443316.1 SDR family oxidoreductase [Shewanella jiangmenensis]